MSVIIPAYNVAPFIAEALDSVRAQTVPVHEVIVVDDGSEDGLADALSRRTDVTTYLKQRNLGPAAARNAGVMAATGRWLAFLDADDTWYPTKIAEQLAAIRPSVGLVFCWKEDFRDGQPNAVRIVAYPEEWCSNPLARMLNRFFPSPSTVLVRRELFLACGGFDSTLRDGSDDADLWIHLAEKTCLAVVTAPLVRYRLRADSICGAQTPRQYTCQIMGPLIRNQHIFMRRLRLSAAQFHRRIAWSYCRFAWRWLRAGCVADAAWAISRALGHCCNRPLGGSGRRGDRRLHTP